MIINDVQFNAELDDIITELQNQLHLNNIPLIQKTLETTTDIMVQCPYHGGGQEKKPSAGIRKSDGMFHCFACNEVHTLPEVISHCFGQDSFGKFGWQWLIKNFATVQIENRTDIKLDFSRNVKPIKKSVYVTEEELDKYRYYHWYWEKRKITNKDIIELFDLGYDKDSKCVTMPVRDINGNCLFVARRSIRGKFFNYPQGVEKPVYGLYEIKTSNVNADEIIICESMIDALTAWQYGKIAVALNGLGTDLQFQQLNKFPCRKYILATDNDNAGMNARRRIKRNLKHKIITQYIIPKGRKDLNDLEKCEFDSLKEIF